MRNAIITGGNGFVGFALIRELLKNDYTVYAIIRQTSVDVFKAKLEALRPHGLNPDNVKIITGDLEQTDLIRTELLKIDTHIDTFYHLAWNGSAGPKRSDLPLQLMNIKIAGDMTDIASELKVGSFVGAGSIMEDEALHMSYERAGKPGINYIYSSAKLEAHLACHIKAQASGLDFRWAKITNAYGEGDNTARFVNTMVRNMLNGEPCAFSKADQLYDFIYITDAARAFRMIGENGKDNSVYVLGSGEATNLRNFINIMAHTTNTTSSLSFSENTTGICYLDKSYFSTASLFDETGFRPEVSFRDGILKTIETIK